MNEAKASNVVQQSLNLLSEDVEKHPELFDSAAARNVIATSTENIDRASAGLLIAGTGGSIPLPAGLGHMIDTLLQNKMLNANTAKAVKKYIADYKSAKDKAIVMQMEMQGGKMGRGNAQAFKAITDQIPNGSTPDSTTARRQLDNLQRTQSELASKFPDKYGSFQKEKPYEYGKSNAKTGEGAQPHPVGSTIVQGGKSYTVTKLDSNGKVVGAELLTK